MRPSYVVLIKTGLAVLRDYGLTFWSIRFGYPFGVRIGRHRLTVVRCGVGTNPYSSPSGGKTTTKPDPGCLGVDHGDNVGHRRNEASDTALPDVGTIRHIDR